MMKSQLLIVAVAFCAGTAVGSTAYFIRPAPSMVAAAPTTHTVSWYLAHQDEWKRKYEACNNNPGAATTDPDCQNAIEAWFKR
jgi:hypothetical protein